METTSHRIQRYYSLLWERSIKVYLATGNNLRYYNGKGQPTSIFKNKVSSSQLDIQNVYVGTKPNASHNVYTQM